jgi:hypothetical protein
MDLLGKASMTKPDREQKAVSQPVALMSDEELVTAADPYVRELLARDLMRGIPDEDGEGFTVYLCWPAEGKEPPFADPARPMPQMLILKDDTKH